MSEYLDAQLDYIFFFYGLAFILLGAICLGATWTAAGKRVATAMGFFGLVHGASEWLDLIARLTEDSSSFMMIRTIVLAGSFLCLIEAVRLSANWFGYARVGPWIYAPFVVLVVSIGATAGNHAACATVRYVFGFIGAMGACLILLNRARAHTRGARTFAILAAVGFGLYAIAAGAIPREAPFWPGNVYNQEWFFQVTGVPIQLVRGLLGCMITFAIWGLWRSEVSSELGSPEYMDYVRKSLRATLATATVILIGGGILTNFLVGNHLDIIKTEADENMEMIASRLTTEIGLQNDMPQVIAFSPLIRGALDIGTDAAIDEARGSLDRHRVAAGSDGGFILNRSGKVVVMAGEAVHSSATSPNFDQALAGFDGHDFVYDAASGRTNYYSSSPIRAKDGAVIGLVGYVRSLGAFGVDLKRSNRLYFFVSPEGIITLTNLPDMTLRPLWGLPADRAAELSRAFGVRDARPLLKQTVADGAIQTLCGTQYVFERRTLKGGEWSVITATSTREVIATRVLGLVITLLAAVMTFLCLFGRDRLFRDRLNMEKRLKLQELAQSLHMQATTDTLTGVSNRLKFNEAMERELELAQRDGTPLSLIVYDVDYFKGINDKHGHQVGDKVLILVSQLAAASVRTSDVLARWGGDEFVILLPGLDVDRAHEVAARIHAAVGQTVFDHGEAVTCTFGVAQASKDDDVESFIAKADAALYRAKSNGRDRIEVSATSEFSKTPSRKLA
jgi:diguanylate cyclase (GGDEF)-like protein